MHLSSLLHGDGLAVLLFVLGLLFGDSLKRRFLEIPGKTMARIEDRRLARLRKAEEVIGTDLFELVCFVLVWAQGFAIKMFFAVLAAGMLFLLYGIATMNHFRVGRGAAVVGLAISAMYIGITFGGEMEFLRTTSSMARSRYREEKIAQEFRP